MQVGVLSQWYDPETGPAALPGVYAREMIRQGNQISVLTGYPNYPTGQIYDGYSQKIRRTRMESGARVTRVPLYASHDSSAWSRIANYSSFALSAATLGARSLAAADAVWVYNSPVSVALPLMTETGLGKKPYFLHVQDLWPDSLLTSKMLPEGSLGRFIGRSVGSIVRTMENRAASIGVISPSVRTLLLERNSDLDPAKLIYVPNPSDEDIFRPQTFDVVHPSTSPWRDTFSVMYMGAVGEAQGLDTVLDAAKLLDTSDQIRIVIVGDGTAKDRLRKRVLSEKIPGVIFRDRIPKQDVPWMMASAKAQLVSLSNDEFLRYTIPSKISSIMASALPIVGQIAGDGAALIQDAGAGLTTTPGDAVALASAITEMSRSNDHGLLAYGRCGHKYYKENLSTEASTSKILGALRHVVER